MSILARELPKSGPDRDDLEYREIEKPTRGRLRSCQIDNRDCAAIGAQPIPLADLPISPRSNW